MSAGLHKYIFITLLAIFACQPPNGTSDTTQEDVVAIVDQKKLLKEDLLQLLPEDMTDKDSLSYMQSLAERWVRDQLLLHEAETRLPENFDINKLLEDYKKSLLLHRFEHLLINQYLDTIIHEVELNEYFENNKESYTLKEDILRLRYVKINKNQTKLDKIKKLIKADQTQELNSLKTLCEQYAEKYILDDMAWFSLTQLKEEFPEKIKPSKLYKKKLVQKSIDPDIHLFYVLDIAKANQAPPLDYVRNQVKKIILQKRKIKLIENIKKQLYEDALQSNRIKILI